jgi:HAE1 family hydrophobic/amphiphilic exporter-1
VNFSEIFIRRPIATSLLMAAIALFGVVAYRSLGVSDLPNVDYPTLTVTASLPGANPDTMASSVATVLERQFTTIAGVDEMTSTSNGGNTQITLQFSLDRDIEGAAVDVQTAIAAALPLLPPGMPFPPSFRKTNPADQPIMWLNLVSNTQTLSTLGEYGENMLAPRISIVDGVAQVQVTASAKYAVRVQLDPDKLAVKNVGLNEVAAALGKWNTNVPTGSLFGPRTAYSLQVNGQLMNAEAFRPMVVSWRKGAPIRLDEVANVVDSVENDKNASWLYGSDSAVRSISLAVYKQPGANTVVVADKIRALLPAFNAKLPPSVSLVLRGDRARNIRQAFQDIQFTMLITLVLVVGVIFVFLRNASATLIPALALPFAILGTFAVMALLNYTLDNMSLMALILSIGFVVDDAIVMLENTVRHIENGEEPYAAALTASREISFTIVSMTISLAAVFIPILFMGGILGRLFREFAVTITVAILVSGLVSVTFTPMLCSRFLRRHDPQQKHNWLSRITESGFQAMFRAYRWSLGGVLQHRYIMGTVFVIVIVATVYLYGIVPKGFIPDQDSDQINLSLEALQGTSFYKMVEYQRQVSDVIRRDPNVLSFMANVGMGNRSFMNIMLKPRRERALTAQQVVNELRPKVLRFPGFRVFLTLPAAIRIGGRQSSSTYQITVQSQDTESLYPEASRLKDAITMLPEVQDVATDLNPRSPRVNVVIDRDRAASYHLDAAQIENALYSAFGPRIASTIYAPTNQYRVLMEIQPKFQEHADYLSKIYFKSSSGQLIPLDVVAKLKDDVMPQSIAHSGQLPSVTLSFNLKPGVSLGAAVEKISELAHSILPPTVNVHFAGSAAAFQSSLKNLSLLLAVAIMVVYIVLGVLYESYIHPLTILSGIPSAGVGALLTLIIFKTELNVYSFVGLIMLIGLVKKNAIMQIDFALEAERKEGKSPVEAIYEGCLIRFRPIMMTTMCALLGALPISLGYGSGGEARRPLGLAVVGGLMLSQLVTLYLTPVVYTFMASILEGWRRRHPAAAEPEPSYTFSD